MKRLLKRFGIWLGAVGLAALLGLPVLTALADNVPKFNQMAGDEELLRGHNTADTTTPTAWTDPVAANDGDVVDVKLWYHNDANTPNGDPGAPAVNTVVKIGLPTGDDTSHILTGSIGADNAPTVTGTFVDGVEVGKPGLTITSALPTTVSLVPGSVRWFPNNSATPSLLPNGQSGDEIITAAGLKLGDINGCWDFAGAVIMQVKLSPAGTPNLVRSKSALNETQNQPATAVKAKAGDKIVYSLKVQNTGARGATAFVINDDLRDVLAYANFVSASDGGVMDNGLIVYPATDIAAGATVTRTVTVQLKPTAEWPTTGDFVLTNVYGNQVDVPVLPPVNQAGVSIAKTVKDAAGSFVEETTVTPNQVATFQVVIKNTGSVVLSGVTILDQPQNGLAYVNGSTTVTRDGRTFAVADEIVTAGGLKLNETLAPGQTITVTLQLKVPAGPINGAKLINTALVRTDQTTEQKDDATVVAQVAAPTPPVVPTPPVAPTGPQLPTTGAGDAGLVLAGLSISGATSLRFWRAKRALARAANRVKIV